MVRAYFIIDDGSLPRDICTPLPVISVKASTCKANKVDGVGAKLGLFGRRVGAPQILWASKGMGLPLASKCYAQAQPATDRAMRERIRERLAEYREEAHERIGSAVAMTKSKFAGANTLTSTMCQLAINEDNKTGFAGFMDRSIAFIRHVAPGQYADELRDGANKMKQEVMGNWIASGVVFSDSDFKVKLDEALDKIIKRKVEDFEFEYVEGKDMNATTNNTVNIINSEISNTVLQIIQSGRDAISKETAQKLEQLVNSDEVKGLPEQTRLEVLDQVSDLIKELKGPTDTGKVHRGLKRLAGFIKSVASNSVAEAVAQIAVAYATAKGLIG